MRALLVDVGGRKNLVKIDRGHLVVAGNILCYMAGIITYQ